MSFELAGKEEKQAILRKILEVEGVVEVKKQDKNGEEKERVLIWRKTINPQKKYASYTSALGVLLGRTMAAKGQQQYGSFCFIIEPIRSLYAGKFDREEAGNPDMKFEFADEEGKRKMLRELLESEGVVKVEERDKEMGGKERVLVWGKKINPNNKSGAHHLRLNILLGRVMNVNGARQYKSNTSIIDPIRSLYAGKFDREEAGNPNMAFEFADVEGRREMLQTLLDEAGVVKVEKRRKADEEGEENVLVWRKTINPTNKYGGYSSPLHTLLGKVMGVEGGTAYQSHASIIDPIRSLYAGMYDREDTTALDIAS